MAGQEKWYFTREQLVNSPSRRCGLDGDKELAYRQQAANLIQDMGQRLQVSQLCINTAIVYMHRFYAFHSFTQFHRNAMAAAALFLAAKVEEQPRKLEHVIRVAHMCLHRSEVQHMDTRSEHYQEQTQDMVFNENVLLQTLGFDVVIDHPHTHVVRTCHLVKASKDLAQTSYFMASNSLHLTTMCLQYKPTVVACFCIHLASKWSNWAIPQSNEGKHWFYYVDRSVTAELLEHLTAEFLHIFDRCPSRLKKKIMSISSTQGTGSPQQSGSHSSSIPNSPFDKEPKKIPQEEYEKVDLDKRQQSLFGPATAIAPSTTSSSAPTPNKMGYGEYRERQLLQQQERRRPTAPQNPSRTNPTAPAALSSQNPAAPRTSATAPSAPPPSMSAQQQHRWPGGVPVPRAKEGQPPHSSATVNSRHHPPHPSSSSSHPHLHSQAPPATGNPPTSRPPHRSGAVPTPVSNPNGVVPSVNNLRPPSRPHPSAPPTQPPPVQVKQPSLFSPEPQARSERPTVNNTARRPAPILPTSMTVPSRELALPTPISPFSSPPTPVLSRRPDPTPLAPSDSISLGPLVTETVPPISALPTHLPVVLPEDAETDPTAVSNLLKESLPRKAEKKKKKEKHKHKDRDRRDERKKHKKDKDRRRESGEPRPPLIPPPPAEPQPDNSDRQIKITIPRERLRTEPQPRPQAPPPVVIKISKTHLEDRKRSNVPSTEAGPPPKMPRHHHHHAEHRHQGPPPPGAKVRMFNPHGIGRPLGLPPVSMYPPPGMPLMMYPRPPPPVRQYFYHNPVNIVGMNMNRPPPPPHHQGHPPLPPPQAPPPPPPPS